jgi:hypothetical protein
MAKDILIVRSFGASSPRANLRFVEEFATDVSTAYTHEIVGLLQAELGIGRVRDAIGGYPALGRTEAPRH